MPSVKEIKNNLFGEVEKYEMFKDPFTGHYPTNEIQLSAMFGLLYQTGKLNLEKIKLYSPEKDEKFNPTNKTLMTIVEKNIAINEWPLFATSQEEIKTYGAMTVDVALIETNKSIILIENKIGSGFTSGGNQLKYQANYLMMSQHINNYEKYIIVLSSKAFFDKRWYIDSLHKVLADEKNKGIEGYLICWEDIFESTNK